MKYNLLFVCIIVCASLECYSQSNMPSRSELEKKIGAAAEKARLEHRAQQKAKAENDARIRSEANAQTQRRIQATESMTRYLEQDVSADNYKKGPQSSSFRQGQNMGKRLTHAEMRNGNVQLSNNSQKSRKSSDFVRSWPIATQPWDYSHYEGGHNAEAVSKMRNAPLFSNKALTAKKFTKPGRVMRPQNKQFNAQNPYIASANVKACYGANNLQGKTTSNEEQRMVIPAKVSTPPQSTAKRQISNQQSQQQNGMSPSFKTSTAYSSIENSQQKGTSNLQKQESSNFTSNSVNTELRPYDPYAPNPDFETRELDYNKTQNTVPVGSAPVVYPETSQSIRISLKNSEIYKAGDAVVNQNNKPKNEGLDMNKNSNHDVTLKDNDPISASVKSKKDIMSHSFYDEKTGIFYGFVEKKNI